ETDTVWEDPDANRRNIRDTLPAADAAVLPELCFTGFTMSPQPDREALPYLQRLAEERRMALVAGLVGDGPRNEAVALGPDGALLARYAKLHPFAFAGEDRHYRVGDALPVFGLGGFRAAMLICYDLRFPEAFREATLGGGAQLFLVLANWPARRVGHWKSLLRARAIVNQAYVIGVNRIGEDPNERYVSSSLAVDPLGEVLLEGPGIVDIDVGHVDRVRADYPFLADVRTDRYRFGTGPGSV
ncbi:MAG: nitrilase-related carbon-nitrogen hydrolase, partial [Planctomycetota bacterium]